MIHEGTSSRKAWMLPIGLIGLICLGGCSGAIGGRTASDSNPGSTVSKHEYGSGPLRMTVRVSPTTTDTAGAVVLSVETEVLAGWTPVEPAVGKKLGGFTVKERRPISSEAVSGNYTRSAISYVLEPFLSGTYTVPRLTAKAMNGTKSISVTSEEVPVTVTSLIPAAAKGPVKLKAIAGPVAVPSTLPEIFAGAVTLLAVIAAGLFLFFGRLRNRRREAEEAVPPWVRATRELDHIVSLNLPARGQHKEFYNSISLLVRRYIEEMFELSAPEQTTEEFLYALRDSPALGRHRRFLSEFLSHCDLVKFAAYLPAQDEVHRAVRSCREFIESSSRDYSGRMESEST